ncbi:hypothetical protein VCCP10303_2224, partial [Vibrio cholerae CP1030(3)]
MDLNVLILPLRIDVA